MPNSQIMHQNERLIVAIPFYRNSQLVASLLDSLINCEQELADIHASILAVVDSPDDQALISELNKYKDKFSSEVLFDVVVNQQNVGFIRSINLAFELAVAERCDIVILNSDVVVFPGALREMRDVAYCDSMIGFVSPRTNNGTICSLPVSEKFRHDSIENSYNNYKTIMKYFSKFDFVPTAVGFAMYIKLNILVDFGGFDEIFGMGYNEENDLVFRANRCGYRAAIANHAFIYHVGEQSFDLLTEKRKERDALNFAILERRYPEYIRSVTRYFESSEFAATKLLENLIADDNGKLDIAFDMRAFRAEHNGTFEAAFKIIKNLVEICHDYKIYCICTPDVFSFHNYDKIEGLSRLDHDCGRAFAAIFRIGQPFERSDLPYLRDRSAVLGVFMLDTIAMDCLYLDDKHLHDIWTKTFHCIDFVLYNSDFTRAQFNLRFDIPKDVLQIPILHSTDCDEYNIITPSIVEANNCTYALVIGNKFDHKFLSPCVESLRREVPDLPLVVVGMDAQGDDKCRYVPSGHLSDDEILELYDRSQCVIFPSHYEGFGFPVMHALAHHKKVFLRDIPVFHELAQHCKYPDNLVFFKNKTDLIDLVKQGDFAWIDDALDVRPMRWEDTSRAILNAINDALVTLSRDGLAKKIEAAKSSSPSNASGAISAPPPHVTVLIDAEWKRRLRWLSWQDKHELSEHVIEALVSRTVLFDEDYYNATYTDVRNAKFPAIRHYLVYGAREGRNPSHWFNTRWYIDTYEDVAKSELNPLVHYLRYGIFENRHICTSDGAHTYRIVPIVERADDLDFM